MNKEPDENLELIKRRLATLRKLPGYKSYNIKIGQFNIRLYANADYSDPPNIELTRVTDYKKVTLEIWEDHNIFDCTSNVHINARLKVELFTDSRFADFYEELRYSKNEFDWQQGRLMPITIVCDVINQIYRIDSLIAFQ
jgi:hypothetical protein